MADEKIQIFCRLLPLPIQDKNIAYELTLDDNTDFEVIEFFESEAWDNVKKKQRAFRFNKVFDQQSHQLDIFQKVAKETVKRAIDGYNGTIFAYGQTGTGKTHTIVGKDRAPTENIDEYSGIIPRSLQYLFLELAKMKIEAKISLSYMEIYRDVAYDLMNKVRGKRGVAASFDELQKVTCRMGAGEKLNLINLKIIEVQSLRDALESFIRGSQNRQMAETSMNDASSRSHCVFTVHMEHIVEDRLLQSKINIVDLAGSERVGKYHEVDKQLMAEAKTINLSLLHLQNVIVALGDYQSQKTRGLHPHVPFRNSTITNILRDSLGGNCKTSMIATVTPDSDNFKETLSTCKFAQRVAKIQLYAKVNVKEDLGRVIRELRAENMRLSEELNNAKIVIGHLKEENLTLQNKLGGLQEQSNLPLSNEDKITLKHIISEYLQNNKEGNFMDFRIKNDSRKVEYCFKLLRFGVNFDDPNYKSTDENNNTSVALTPVKDKNYVDGIEAQENQTKRKEPLPAGKKNTKDKGERKRRKNMFCC